MLCVPSLLLDAQEHFKHTTEEMIWMLSWGNMVHTQKIYHLDMGLRYDLQVWSPDSVSYVQCANNSDTETISEMHDQFAMTTPIG